MTEIRFVVRGRAVPQGSTRAFVVKGRAVTTNKTINLTAWRNLVASEAQKIHQGQALLGGALRLDVDFTFERPKSHKKTEFHIITKPDLDKLIRAVMDALTGVVWHDDSQVAVVHASKSYARYAACEIKINQLPYLNNVDIVSDGGNDII